MIATVVNENIVVVWIMNTHLVVPVLSSNAFIHWKNITTTTPGSIWGEDRWMDAWVDAWVAYRRLPPR